MALDGSSVLHFVLPVPKVFAEIKTTVFCKAYPFFYVVFCTVIHSYLVK